MTVIYAAERFARRRSDSGLWVALRSGGAGPLADYQHESLLSAIVAEAEAEYGVDKPLSVFWDDVSCCHMEILHETTDVPVPARGSVDVDGYHYSIKFVQAGVAAGEAR